MGIVRKYKRIITVLLLTIFTAYYVNISFFYHCHTINGVTIVHSHFYGKNHANSTQSSSEVTLISTLSLFETFAAELFCIAAMLFVLQAILGSRPFAKRSYVSAVCSISLRAPPAF